MNFRVAFLGTPDFAVPSLQALHKADYDIVAVYTQPPRPKGRGHHLQKSPIHLLAETMGFPVFTPQTLKDPLEQQRFSELQLDFAIVVAYGLILPPAILAAPRLGCINVHASLLPRWRGAAPIQRAILAGDHETGVTIMLMDQGLDTGPMLSKHALPLTTATTATSLYEQLACLGAKGLCPALEDFAAGKCQPTPQPDEGVTLAPKLTHEEGRLDWQQDAATLERAIRALNPWPGTWFEHLGTRIKVFEAIYVGDTQASPGMFIDDQLTVACQVGALRLTKLQRPGGQALPSKDFLNGYPLPKGTRL
ncbi:MAG: methionyl-tRNA formyltransferase [Alphaproteobacteria bacterium]